MQHIKDILPDYAEKLLARQTIRTIKQIQAEEQKLTDRVWYERHQMMKEQMFKDTPSDIIRGALEAAKKIEAKYDKEFLTLPEGSDFEWGLINGKLSALRWILGDDWDMLDS